MTPPHSPAPSTSHHIQHHTSQYTIQHHSIPHHKLYYTSHYITNTSHHSTQCQFTSMTRNQLSHYTDINVHAQNTHNAHRDRQAAVSCRWCIYENHCSMTCLCITDSSSVTQLYIIDMKYKKCILHTNQL